MTDSASKPTSYRYWAFISHSSHDRSWAKWIHRSIEHYGIPAELISHPTPVGEPAPRRFYPIFHYRTDLAASPSLAEAISSALRDSRYLVVICSPDAAKSSWVAKEIEDFQALGRQDRVLAVIVGGEPGSAGPTECFPPPLHGNEPGAPDVRPGHDGRTNARLKLLAAMLGVEFDTLKRRDANRRIKQLQKLVGLAVLVIAALTTLSIYAFRAERRAKDAAERLRFQVYCAQIQHAADVIQGSTFSSFPGQETQAILASTPKDLRGWEFGFLAHLSSWMNLVPKRWEGDVWTFEPSITHLNSVDEVPAFRAEFLDRLDPRFHIGALTRSPTPSGPAEALMLQWQSGWPLQLALSNSGSRVLTLADDGVLRIWDAASGEELANFREESSRGRCLYLAFSHNDDSILAVYESLVLRRSAWTGEVRSQAQVAGTHAKCACLAAWSPEVIAVGCDDGTIRLYGDHATPLPTLTRVSNGPVEAISAAPGSGSIAVLAGGVVSVRRASDLSAAQSFPVPSGTQSVVLYEDARRVAAISPFRIDIWDSKAKQLTATLEAPYKEGNAGFNAVCVMHDGSRLVTGDLNGNVRFFDSSTGEQVMALHFRRTGSSVLELRTSADGRFIAMALGVPWCRLLLFDPRAHGEWGARVRSARESLRAEVQTVLAKAGSLSKAETAISGREEVTPETREAMLQILLQQAMPHRESRH